MNLLRLLEDMSQIERIDSSYHDEIVSTLVQHKNQSDSYKKFTFNNDLVVFYTNGEISSWAIKTRSAYLFGTSVEDLQRLIGEGNMKIVSA